MKTRKIGGSCCRYENLRDSAGNEIYDEYCNPHDIYKDIYRKKPAPTFQEFDNNYGSTTYRFIIHTHAYKHIDDLGITCIRANELRNLIRTTFFNCNFYEESGEFYEKLGEGNFEHLLTLKANSYYAIYPIDDVTWGFMWFRIYRKYKRIEIMRVGKNPRNILISSNTIAKMQDYANTIDYRDFDGTTVVDTVDVEKPDYNASKVAIQKFKTKGMKSEKPTLSDSEFIDNLQERVKSSYLMKKAPSKITVDMIHELKLNDVDRARLKEILEKKSNSFNSAEEPTAVEESGLHTQEFQKGEVVTFEKKKNKPENGIIKSFDAKTDTYNIEIQGALSTIIIKINRRLIKSSPKQISLSSSLSFEPHEKVKFVDSESKHQTGVILGRIEGSNPERYAIKTNEEIIEIETTKIEKNIETEDSTVQSEEKIGESGGTRRRNKRTRRRRTLKFR